MLRQANRRLEQLGPRQVAALFVRHLQGAQYPWRAHRAPANLRIRERHRRTVGLQEQTLCRPGRCCFAAVVSLHVVPIPQHDERTAADAGRLRFHQGQYRLHGNRRINGRTALAQHFTPGFGGQRVGGGSHMALGVAGAQVGAIARAQLRGRWLFIDRRVAGGKGQGGGDDCQAAAGNQKHALNSVHVEKVLWSLGYCVFYR